MNSTDTTCDNASREPVRAVIFDLDDTLYPRLAYDHSAFRAVAEYVRVAYGWRILDELLQTTGEGDALAVVLKALARHAPDVGAGLATRVEAVMITHMPRIVPHPSAQLCLALLPRKGIRTAVVATGDPAVQRLKVKALGLSALADSVIYPADLMGPDHVAEALHLLSMQFDAPLTGMVFAGNGGTTTRATAGRLGMFVVRVPRGDRAAEPGETVLDSLDEMPDFLERLPFCSCLHPA